MKNAKSYLALPNMASWLLGLLILVIWWQPPGDLDHTWQIRMGEQIVRTGQLHPPETFTYTINGQHLPDFEWLYEVLLFYVWQLSGPAGLQLGQVFCVLAPLALVGWRLRRAGVGWYVIAMAWTIAVLVLIPTWNIRPFSCTTIGLLLLSGWLHDHCLGRRQLGWGVPLLMLLWANLHPGIITGQGLLAGAIGWEWLNRWLRFQKPLDADRCWRLTWMGGLGLLASLICPGPLTRLEYTFGSNLRHPIMRQFAEMQPLYALATQRFYLPLLVYLVAALVLLTLVLRFRQYRMWEVALLAGLALLGNMAFRSVQDWLLVMFAIGLPHLAVLFGQAAAWYHQQVRSGRHTLTMTFWRGLWFADRTVAHVLGAPLFRFQLLWPAAVLGVLLLLVLPPFSALVPRREHPRWPTALANFVEREDLAGRFFAAPDQGAYLAWRRGERALVYTDTRGFFFPPGLLEDCFYLPQLAPGWQERLQRVLDQGTDYLVLEKNDTPGALWRLLEPQATPLFQDSELVLLRAEQVRLLLFHP